MLIYVRRLAIGFMGGIFCALVWFLMDSYLFGNTRGDEYYLAVVFAYVAGYGPFSNAPSSRHSTQLKSI